MRRLQQSLGQDEKGFFQENMEIFQLEEVDYHMTDMNETDSINDQSLVILEKNQDKANKKQNIFN